MVLGYCFMPVAFRLIKEDEMGIPLRVLIVEDSEDDTLLLVRELKRGGYDPIFERVDTPEAMAAALEIQTWDIVIADYVMPHFSGLNALKLLQKSGLDIPFIIVSGSIGEDTAVAAMKAGANDYLMKNKLARLIPSIEQELREAEVRGKLVESEKVLKESEEKYRLLVENANEAIFVIQDGMLRFFNIKNIELTGYSKEELTSTPFINFVHPDDREVAIGRYLKRIRGEELPGVNVSRVIDKAGNIKWAEVNSVLISWEGRPATLNFLNDITERKQAEEALSASEEKYRTLFEGAAEGILVADIESKQFKYANPAICRMLGYTIEELMRLGVVGIHPKEALDHVMAEFNAQTRGEKTLVPDIPCLRKDSSIIYASIATTPVVIDGRKCNVGFFTDITERKRAEKALEESQKRYRQVVENATEIIYAVDEKGNFTYGNPAGLKVTGYSLAELRSFNYADLVLPEHRERVMEIYINQFRQRIPTTHVEFPFFNKAGKIIWFAQNTSLVIEDGKVVGFHMIARDITERKKAEQALVESEQRYRNLVENAPDVIYTLASDGTITSLNPAFETITGWSRTEWLGKQFTTILHPDDLPLGMEFWQRILQGEMPPIFELRILSKSGDYVVGEFIATPQTQNGSVINVLGIARDITERKRAEERLSRINECFLSFSTDPSENINRLTALCGEVMEATCALYNRIDGDVLCSVGKWNTPPDYNPMDKPEGHICYDVIQRGGEDIYIVHDLPHTKYAKTDPNVTPYKLQTYIGKAVKWQGAYVGSLCVVYQKDFFPDEADLKTLGIIASAISIEEERKQSEVALRRSKREWENTFDAITDWISLLDLEARILRTNDVGEKFAGIPLAEMVGLTCCKLTHGSEKPLQGCPFQKMLKTQHRESKEVQLSDEGRWSIITVDPVVDEKGNLVGAVHIVRDITERKRAEEAFRESEKRYRQVVENAVELIYSTDINGIFTYANAAALKACGYSLEELRRLNYLDLVVPEHRERVTSIYADQFREKRGSTYVEFPFHAKSGEVVWFGQNASLVFEGKKFVGLHVIARDITERKHAEDEREKMQAQLIQAQKMESIGTLAGGVAHDFNNLLTTIQGYAQLAMMSLKESDPLYENLKEIHRASIRAANLTRQLLLFSRQQRMEVHAFSLNDTLNNLMKMLKRLIGEDITVDTHLEPNLWTVRADPGNVEQLIMNLVVNAKDAMPEGGKIIIKTENVCIDRDYCKTYSYARPGEFACLLIQDTGIGMDKEIVQHIFEPFFTTKRVGKGTGLGLSVVYGIVKQHEGWINVYSEPGQGSTFKVYLPASSEESKEETREEIVSIQDYQGKGERILLVEDDGGIREFAKRVLVDSGYEGFEAANSEEALNLFDKEKGNFDLVFSDVVLPGKSGLQLVEELHSRKPELKVLLTSGYTDQKSQWPIIREKGYRFIQKPYGLTDLLQAVRKVLDKKGIRKESR